MSWWNVQLTEQADGGAQAALEMAVDPVKGEAIHL
uniref:Uncharacterized protein n=1 Tax=Oryza punctata TaxID=4537 RepID=A0A0E0LJX1_ORYPU